MNHVCPYEGCSKVYKRGGKLAEHINSHEGRVSLIYLFILRLFFLNLRPPNRLLFTHLLCRNLFHVHLSTVKNPIPVFRI